MLILRNTDRVPCKIGKLTVWVSPLSWGEKTNMFRHASIEGGEVKADQTKLLAETIRLSVKKVEGLESYQFSDGSGANIEFDESGYLTQDSLELLIRIVGATEISLISSAIITDSINEDIPGWEIDMSKVEDTSKKKS